jgi:hypothetical protein
MELTDFKDIHRGERCFIIGTGPSLNITNLSLIRDEIIFGCNTLYKGLDQWKLKCRYYGISDIHVLRNHYTEIAKLDTTLFLALYAAREYLDNKEKYKDLNPIVIKNRVEEGFSLDPNKGIHWGSSVIYDVGLHMCYYMGFKEVYLLGVDWDYSGMHHFDGSKADYIGQGSAGNWKRALESYPQAKKAFEDDGRKIYNSTVGGKMELFQRVPLEVVMERELRYISEDKVKLTTSYILLIYAWYAKIRENIRSGKPWYYGLPYTWWWGKSPVSFLRELPHHITEEKDWSTDIW